MCVLYIHRHHHNGSATLPCAALPPLPLPLPSPFTLTAAPAPLASPSAAAAVSMSRCQHSTATVWLASFAPASVTVETALQPLRLSRAPAPTTSCRCHLTAVPPTFVWQRGLASHPRLDEGCIATRSVALVSLTRAPQLRLPSHCEMRCSAAVQYSTGSALVQFTAMQDVRALSASASGR